MGEAKENMNIVRRTNWKESAGTLIFLFLYLLSFVYLLINDNVIRYNWYWSDWSVSNTKKR